jgi:hypothetical protein
MKSIMITVFIHGTLLTGNTLGDFVKKIHDFFYCPQGITQLADLDSRYHVSKIGKWMCEADPCRFKAEDFYLYGWSGQLSDQARTEAAEGLFAGLRDLREKYYKEQGVYPQIRLVTHSHGGNVALHLADVSDHSFVIDELVLLACPVQKETEEHVHNSLFSTVYSFFSTIDAFQVVDPQALNALRDMSRESGFSLSLLKEWQTKKIPLFSQRRFALGDNLMQASIKRSIRGIAHIEFLFKPFIQRLPIFLDELDKHRFNGCHIRKKKGYITLTMH